MFEHGHALVDIACTLDTNLDTTHENALLTLLVLGLLLVAVIPVVDPGVNHLQVRKFVVLHLGLAAELLLETGVTILLVAAEHVAPNTVAGKHDLLRGS